MLRRPLTQPPAPLLLAASRSHGALGLSTASHGHKEKNPVPATHVTAPVFAGLLRKTGLSTKKLHMLDAAAQQHQQRIGSAAFPIAVALSGGADSMALTLLLRDHLHQQKIATPLLAITVDHRLRSESTQEARDVGQMVTEAWGVEHVIAQCEWASGGEDDASTSTETAMKTKRQPVKPRGSKLQEEARRYRYALLQQVCREKQVKYLFVAHNLGDQLETVLFRLGRASGINGLAGIASVSTLFTSGGDNQEGASALSGDNDDRVGNEPNGAVQVQLIRPLLSISKTQLKATCRRFKQEWVEDPSNEKLQFDRIRIRKVVRLAARYDIVSRIFEMTVLLSTEWNLTSVLDHRSWSDSSVNVAQDCWGSSRNSSKALQRPRRSLHGLVRYN